MEIFEEKHILRFCTAKTISETPETGPIVRKTSKGPIIPRNFDKPSRGEKKQNHRKEYKEKSTQKCVQLFAHSNFLRSKSI